MDSIVLKEEEKFEKLRNKILLSNNEDNISYSIMSHSEDGSHTVLNFIALSTEILVIIFF